MALQPFATVQQLESGWRELSSAEESVASTLLLRATAQLTSLLNAHGITVDSDDDVQATNLEAVCCNMVRRSMASYSTDGIQSMQQSVGNTSASVTWSNPDGAFYLSRLDRQTLGLSASGMYRGIPAHTVADDVTEGSE